MDQPRLRLSKRQEGFWGPADTLGPAAVKTFIEPSEQGSGVDKPHDGSKGVAGYGGEARKPAACSNMALEFSISAFFEVARMFPYRALTKCMDVGAVLELCIRNAVMNTG